MGSCIVIVRYRFEPRCGAAAFQELVAGALRNAKGQAAAAAGRAPAPGLSQGATMYIKCIFWWLPRPGKRLKQTSQRNSQIIDDKHSFGMPAFGGPGTLKAATAPTEQAKDRGPRSTRNHQRPLAIFPHERWQADRRPEQKKDPTFSPAPFASAPSPSAFSRPLPLGHQAKPRGTSPARHPLSCPRPATHAPKLYMSPQ